MMRLSVAQRSECGGRRHNEDSLGFCGNDKLGCFVLADGCGGYGGGAIASRLVVRQILSFFSSTPVVEQETIIETLPVARKTLAEARQRYPLLDKMDTTLVTLLLDMERQLAYWSYLGDSRLYLFRHGRAQILTSDHTILQSMIDAGLISGDARGNHLRNTLYASVGSDEPPTLAMCEKPLQLQPDDIFLLCSDGFWGSIQEHEMEQQLQGAKDPEQWLDNMMRLPDPTSKDQDNFSAMAIWTEEREEQTRRSPPIKPDHTLVT
jgi:serine/threonine protein phosphatase PrpC